MCYFEVAFTVSWYEIPGCTTCEHEMLILLTIPGHTYIRNPKIFCINAKMEGQEEPLSDTDTTSSTDLELVALDNLRCFHPSSQPYASQPSSQTSASTSTAPPLRLQTYSSKQRRLQVTRCTKGTVEDTALFTSSTFAEQCYHIIQFLHSPEIDRCFPDYLNDKHARQNFKRKAERYKWNETRQKLFYPKDDQFKNSK